MKQFEGKHAIVTGGGGFLGGTICRHLLEQGAKVAIFDINFDAAQRVAAGDPDALPVALDLTDAEAVETATAQVLQTFGSVELLVNAAGGDDTILQTATLYISPPLPMVLRMSRRLL